MKIPVIVSFIFNLFQVIGVVFLIELSVDVFEYFFVLVLFFLLDSNNLIKVVYKFILGNFLIHMLAISINLVNREPNNIKHEFAPHIIRYFCIGNKFLSRLFVKPFTIILV
jgi:hypothetical protein